MRDSMTPDERIWVEQAIAIYLRSGAFMTEIPALLVGRVLAQILYYWRCEVPEKWDFATGNTNYAGLAYAISDDLKSVFENTLDCSRYGPDIYAALDNNDWDKMLALPDPVWKMVTDHTALSKDQWMGIADKAESVLESKVSCPDCGSVFALQDIGAPDEVSDPFSMTSSRESLRFVCPKCSHCMVLNASEHAMVQPSKNNELITNIPLVVIVVISVVIVLIVLNRLL